MSKHSEAGGKRNHVARVSNASGRRPSALSRRAWLGIAVGGAATALIAERWWRNSNPGVIPADATPITVYASPGCGCCRGWVAHLERNRFHVTVENLVDVTPVKRRLGVPDSLWSCHTAMVSGYIVEGHVPADLIQRVLAERPSIAGLSVPGMPNGSPGMEGIMRERYEIVAFSHGGGSKTYAVR